MSGVLDVLLAEYADLRAEIHQRVNNQLLILGGNVALLAALLPGYDRLDQLAPLSFLSLPLLFGIIAWLYFEQDIFLTQAATYLHRELKAVITEELEHQNPQRSITVFDWERFRGEALFGRTRERRLLRVMTGFRYLATMGPALVAWVLGLGDLITSSMSGLTRGLGIVLLGLDVVLMVSLAMLAGLVLKLYREITE